MFKFGEAPFSQAYVSVHRVFRLPLQKRRWKSLLQRRLHGRIIERDSINRVAVARLLALLQDATDDRRIGRYSRG